MTAGLSDEHFGFGNEKLCLALGKRAGAAGAPWCAALAIPEAVDLPVSASNHVRVLQAPIRRRDQRVTLLRTLWAARQHVSRKHAGDADQGVLLAAGQQLVVAARQRKKTGGQPGSAAS